MRDAAEATGSGHRNVCQSCARWLRQRQPGFIHDSHAIRKESAGVKSESGLIQLVLGNKGLWSIREGWVTVLGRTGCGPGKPHPTRMWYTRQSHNSKTTISNCIVSSPGSPRDSPRPNKAKDNVRVPNGCYTVPGMVIDF